ncbi:phosphopantothenoylcysteine decarboxylase [Methanolapillus ohkumae]|uniref:phosphopantothenoylcysteine decarboxylase domain-containing protein n=1 Tax=Methanolapillus ohkumae TaxID=3028298 RepID=UPI0030B8DD5B
MSGKTIVIGVTGSIAAVSVVTLARELIRNGAEVFAVMTEAAAQIIHPNALHYATGNAVITKLSGRVEHVEFFGSFGRADLLLIAPATANTISKIAAGVDDTPVTTFATTAIGERKKVMIVPAMHESMYHHPKVTENLKILESWGIEIVGPRIEEGVAKIATNDEIIHRVKRFLNQPAVFDPSDRGPNDWGPNDLEQTDSPLLFGKNILITSGSTAESVDPIRILTNRASGKTGTALAFSAYEKGAEVYLFHRNKLGLTLPHLNEIYVESAKDMTKAVVEKIEEINKNNKSNKSRQNNILISAAAISDYSTRKNPGKIKSGQNELILSLYPTKKLIEEAKRADPDLFVAAFKAESGISFEKLIESAAQKINEGIADCVIANDVKERGMGTDDNDVFLVFKDIIIQWIPISGSKEKIADDILNYIAGVHDIPKKEKNDKTDHQTDHFKDNTAGEELIPNGMRPDFSDPESNFDSGEDNVWSGENQINRKEYNSNRGNKKSSCDDLDFDDKVNFKDGKLNPKSQKSGRYKKPVLMKGRFIKK